MWRTLDGLSRYIATPTVAKHRLFVRCDARSFLSRAIRKARFATSKRLSD